MSDAKCPHVQAAFINAIREEGTKAEACDTLQALWNECCAQAAELTRLRAREYKLAALLKRAREELYMIRMKDSGAVYDVTLRMELADALSAYEEARK